MKISMFQMKNEGLLDLNLKKSLSAAEQASKKGADLIFFPEVQLSEFFAQKRHLDVKKYLLDFESPEIKAFCGAAKKFKIMICPNIYLKQGGKAYDANLFIDKSGRIIGTQKMVHIANAPMFYEQDYYTQSDEGFKVFETPFGKIGIVICFDRHYPESIRTEALMGADLILIPTANTKSEPGELFLQEVRVQAFQNSVAAAMCNRVGKEDEMEFSGQSVAFDPNGKQIVRGGEDEELLIFDYDLKMSKKIRSSKPYTNLRRPEFYL